MSGNPHDFPAIPPDDDLVVLLETLKEGLTSHATNGHWDDEEYRRIRKMLLSHPGIRSNLPEFLTKCRSLQDFWGYIKPKFGTYQGRRGFLAECLNPIIDLVEQGAESFGDYELGERIGQGGFSQVFLATHRLLGRPFAVKVFQPAFSLGGEDYLTRFFQEANMLYEMNHPNIIRVHGIGLAGRRPYFVMDYFKGRNLNQALMQFGAFKPDTAALLIQLIAQAIQHAHNMGIVHRDLKPSNVLIAPKQQCRVIDFGLGVYIEPQLESRLTKTGHGVGGDHFTAPELLASPKLVDPRCDIYSIGALWYHILTNAMPSGASVSERLKAVAGLHNTQFEIIMRCLGGIDERFQSCHEILEAMNQPHMLTAGAFQSQSFAFCYLGGDPRFRQEGNGTVSVDPTSLSVSVISVDGSPTPATFAWPKGQVRSAYDSAGDVVFVTVDDPEGIMERGFEMQFQFESEWHAKLFAKRCCDILDAVPF